MSMSPDSRAEISPRELEELEEERNKYRSILETIAAVCLDGEVDPETESDVDMDIDSAFGLLSSIVEEARSALEATKEGA